MLELAQLIVEYDVDYNEYDDTIFEVAKTLEDPNKVVEMIQKYTDRLAFHQEIADDFQSFSPRTREVALYNIKRLNHILKILGGMYNDTCC